MNKLIMAVMYPSQGMLEKSLKILTDKFGEIYVPGPEYDFNFTDYYVKEFGVNLKKKIFIFRKTIEKRDLIWIREETGKIEESISIDGKRIVNIDPGYVSETEVVLATKKGKWFKEDLGNGIFAHKVLEFKDGDVIMFKHTFADYKIKENVEFLSRQGFK